MQSFRKRSKSSNWFIIHIMIWWWCWELDLLRQLSPTFGPAPYGGLQHRLHGPHFSARPRLSFAARGEPALRLGALATAR